MMCAGESFALLEMLSPLLEERLTAATGQRKQSSSNSYLSELCLIAHSKVCFTEFLPEYFMAVSARIPGLAAILVVISLSVHILQLCAGEVDREHVESSSEGNSAQCL